MRIPVWLLSVLLLVGSLPTAQAVGPYGLPICQMINDDTERDPVLWQAQMDYCDDAEAALIEFINTAEENGIERDAAAAFVMLFFAGAHWEILTEMEIVPSVCGDGTCDEDEDEQSCPDDCDDGGPGTGGGPGGVGGEV